MFERSALAGLPGVDDCAVPGFVGINEGSRVDRPSPAGVARIERQIALRPASFLPRFTVPELCFTVRLVPVDRQRRFLP